MLLILQSFADIALLRRGPQSLPASTVLLCFAVLGVGALSLLPVPGQTLTLTERVVIYVLYAAMTLSVIGLLLNSMGRSERFVQTATAMFGADLILACVKLFVVFLFPDTLELYEQNRRYSGGLLLRIALEAWSLCVMSSILRAAMSISVLQSFGIIVLIMMLYFGAAGLVLRALMTGT